MSKIIGIVKIGTAGNIHSIIKAIARAGGEAVVIQNAGQFSNVDKIVLPGVGSFKEAMDELNNCGLAEVLLENLQSKHALGICLGMQILAKIGFEYGKTSGLAILEAEVKPMIVDAKVPHVGFNLIRIVNPNKLLSGLDDKEFYFMHSYELVNYTNVSSLTSYAGHTFVSSVQQDNIYGVQFHPEKSRDSGIKLFENFINL